MLGKNLSHNIVNVRFSRRSWIDKIQSVGLSQNLLFRSTRVEFGLKVCLDVGLESCHVNRRSSIGSGSLQLGGWAILSSFKSCSLSGFLLFLLFGGFFCFFLLDRLLVVGLSLCELFLLSNCGFVPFGSQPLRSGSNFNHTTKDALLLLIGVHLVLILELNGINTANGSSEKAQDHKPGC